MEELLKNTISQSGLKGNEAKKAYKKALKKVESSGGYNRVLDELTSQSQSQNGSQSSEGVKGDIRARLREKINRQKMLRCGSIATNNRYQKEEETARNKASEILESKSKSKSKTKSRNTENHKLNKLEKRLGQITLDVYQKACEKVEILNTNRDELVYYHRIIKLYRRQNKISTQERDSLDELDSLL